MENEHDVEHDELWSRNSQCQANENGVEYDAEFENEDPRQLCGILFCCQPPGSGIVMLIGIIENRMTPLAAGRCLLVGLVTVRLRTGPGAVLVSMVHAEIDIVSMLSPDLSVSQGNELRSVSERFVSLFENHSTSTKNRAKTAMRAIPSGHGYAVIGPDKHPSPSASFAGARS